MKQIRVSLIAATAFAGAALALSYSANVARADDAVVAKLNGQEIKESDLSLAEAEVGTEIANLPPVTRRRVLVEYLIETKLFADAAEAAKLTSGADFEKRVAYWKTRAMRDAFYQKNVKESISEAVAKGIYDDKVKMIPPQDEIEASHILVATEEKAKELSDKATAGEDFAKLAAANSTDTGSAAQGGKLGYFSKGQMVKEFDEAAFALKKGEVSKPVKTQFGWHVIKVEDRRQKPLPTFDEVKGQIMGNMVQQKGQQVAQELRGKASIEYVDSEIKLQVEQEAVANANKKKAFDKQMEEQIKKMEEQEKLEKK